VPTSWEANCYAFFLGVTKILRQRESSIFPIS